MTPATPTPETELTPELIDRVRKLSPESREQLRTLLGETHPIPDLPPVGDWEYWKAEIERRVEAVENGEEKGITPEEMFSNVRKALEEARRT